MGLELQTGKELLFVVMSKISLFSISLKLNSNELVGYRMELEMEFWPANRVEIFICGFPIECPNQC